MPVYKSKYFPESPLAHRLLDGLKGVEIGGSIHNAFGVDVINVDYTADMNTVFKQAEKDLTYARNGIAEAMPVDVVADGAKLPFGDKSFDFVLNSHVVEHIFDPISAIKEWLRVARKYVYMVVPHRNADTNDVGRPLTTIQEFMGRHSGAIPPPVVDDHRHWSVWTPDSFQDMCEFYGFKVLHRLDVDDKVGNGFVIVLDASGNKIELQQGGIRVGVTADEVMKALDTFGNQIKKGLKSKKK